MFCRGTKLFKGQGWITILNAFLAKYDLYADAPVLYDDDEKEVVWRIYEREEE